MLPFTGSVSFVMLPGPHGSSLTNRVLSRGRGMSIAPPKNFPEFSLSEEHGTGDRVVSCGPAPYFPATPSLTPGTSPCG